MAIQRYDFGNSIGYIINRTAKAYVKAVDSQLREKVGVTVGQWKVLVMLVDQNGLTQKEIADRLGLEGARAIAPIDAVLCFSKMALQERPPSCVTKTPPPPAPA